jgi:hypothetical protein
LRRRASRKRLREDYFKVENEEDGTKTAIDRKTPGTLQKLNSSANQVKTGGARARPKRESARGAANNLPRGGHGAQSEDRRRRMKVCR